MVTSQKGVDLIKSFEGCRLQAYKALPSEKYYTIGYGHYGADVKSDMTITSEEAESMLKRDLQRFERYVENTGLELNQAQFDSLVSFTYNCGPGNLKKLVAGRSLNEIADAMLNFNHGGGKVLKGLTRRRTAERELFKSEDKVEVMIIVGSARIDENGKTTGGKKGDQKQTQNPDYSGEVSFQKFYKHKKGWYVLRPKTITYARNLANAMKKACLNIYIGYNQNERLDIIEKGIDTRVATNCDCSSLVRACIIRAMGIDPGNFITSNEADKLEATGLFEKRVEYTDGMKLYEGDVLITKTKGHTVIVTESEYTRAVTFLTVKYRMVGKEVVALQNALNLHGYNLDTDGVFGKLTLEAVKDYQKNHGLEVDGIVGKNTWSSLLS